MVFLGGLRVTNPPVRLTCPTSFCPPDIQVEHHDSLYGIAFGGDSCIAKWKIAT